MTLQLIAQSIRQLVPYAGSLLGILALLVIVALVVRMLTNAEWRKLIRFHLPAIARQELSAVEADRDHWKSWAERLSEENEQLSVAVRGARNLLDMPHLEARRREDPEEERQRFPRSIKR